jgi:hypothetical protein
MGEQLGKEDLNMALLQECPRCKQKLFLKCQVEVKDGVEVKKVLKVREECCTR